jgi:hypothetical protein
MCLCITTLCFLFHTECLFQGTLQTQKFSSCVYIAANVASGALFLNLQKWLRAPRVIIY